MKPIRNVLILLALSTGCAMSQPLSSCTNADFELGNFSNWVAKTGWCYPINMTNTGVVYGRHTIMSAGGTDPFSLGLIPFVPPGYGAHTVRLGNSNVGSEAEQLIYAFTVTSQNALFIYRYAVVLEDPGHTPALQPRFMINVFDQAGLTIPCGTYNVVSSGSIPGFVNNGDYRIKPWTTVGIDLSAYIGQTVRIEFTTADCGLGGHFGYAYMECYCSPFQIYSDFCPGLTFATLQAPVGFTNYLWSTGDTTPSITIQNPVNGSNYSVTMTSVTGCQVTLTTILTQSSIIAAFYLSTFCANHVNFVDSSYVLSGSPITQWHWDFGDGTSSSSEFPLHAYQDSGTYNVQLTIVNAGGCIDSITIPIQTEPFPTSNFNYIPACPWSPVAFNDFSQFIQGTITDWHWNFGNGDTSAVQNPWHAFDGYNDTVTLTITASNGCSDSISQVISSLPAPTASFIPHWTCMNAPSLFSDASYINTGTILSAYWDFGDGNVAANNFNPVHIFDSAWTFTVMLISTASNGCIDTASHQIVVRPAPDAGFNVVPACLNDDVLFSDNSTIQSGTITQHHWYFGDGDSLSGTLNIYHAYDTAGIYPVTLIVTSNYGCRDTVIIAAEQMALPVADFSGTTVCLNAPVSFADLSTLENGTIVQWLWDFGDSTGQGISQNPVHVFQDMGNHRVQLVVTGSNGCVDTAVSYLNTEPSPVSLFTASPACAQHNMHFADGSSLAGGTIDAWDWDFGDGSQHGASQNPDHIFSNSGNHLVTLLVTGSNGCTGTEAIQVFADPLPQPYFINSVSCKNDPMLLTDMSVVSTGSIVSWQWNIDDTLVTGIQNPSFSFGDLLLHKVKLVTTTNAGCSDSLVQFVRLNPYPDPRMITTDGCFPGNNLFVDDSKVQWGNIVAWQWEFGDSTAMATTSTVSHTYAAPGVYQVELAVVSDAGCRASMSRPAKVWRKPISDFLPDQITGCEPLLVNFTNQSTSEDGDIVAWQWNFGNGATDSVANGQTVFEQSGIYDASLVVTTGYGCSDTLQYKDLITVFPSPEAGFTFTPPVTNIYDPTVVFSDNSLLAAQWGWNFGDRSTSDEVNPVHTFHDAGKFDVQLIVYTDKGCPDTVDALVEIRPEYLYVIPNAFTPDGDGINDFFIGQGIGVKNFTMYIFDRWGAKIYETSNQLLPWDGRYNDQPVQQDVYVYKIELTDVFESYHEFVGHVTVMR